jgi:hypothetical protein
MTNNGGWHGALGITKPVKFEAAEKRTSSKIDAEAGYTNHSATPTGLQPSAQRCRDSGAATLGR